MAEKTKPKAREGSLFLSTFRRIVNYLQEQPEPIAKSRIVRELNIPYNSVKIAIAELEGDGLIEYDSQGRIKIKK